VSLLQNRLVGGTTLASVEFILLCARNRYLGIVSTCSVLDTSTRTHIRKLGARAGLVLSTRLFSFLKL